MLLSVTEQWLFVDVFEWRFHIGRPVPEKFPVWTVSEKDHCLILSAFIGYLLIKDQPWIQIYSDCFVDVKTSEYGFSEYLQLVKPLKSRKSWWFKENRETMDGKA